MHTHTQNLIFFTLVFSFLFFSFFFALTELALPSVLTHPPSLSLVQSLSYQDDEFLVSIQQCQEKMSWVYNYRDRVFNQTKNIMLASVVFQLQTQENRMSPLNKSLRNQTGNSMAVIRTTCNDQSPLTLAPINKQIPSP